MTVRQKPSTIASRGAAAELNARLGMDIKGKPDDPLANAINRVIPNRVTRDEKGVQQIGPNDRTKVRRDV